ncbi:effector-associated constant component EACC1 [Nonomuraea jabiensis]|uniref:effector-associated constant component EACC1 n=1 Tax=Nonomuraea jabiensis TaxID=882448 RepID=UPI003D72A92D
MEVRLGVDAESADEVRDLHAWLADEPELRGRVHLMERPPADGRLGPVAEGMTVFFGAGGALATVAGVVVAWLGSRKGEVTVRIRREESEVEVSAKGVRALSLAETRALTAHLFEVLNGVEDPHGEA